MNYSMHTDLCGTVLISNFGNAFVLKSTLTLTVQINPFKNA